MRIALILFVALALGCVTASFDPQTGKSSATALGQAKAKANAEGISVEGGPLSDGTIGAVVGVFKPLAEAVRGFFGGTPPNVIVNMPDQVTVKPAEPETPGP